MPIKKKTMQGTKEFCGRCIAVPLVKLSMETYSPPDFPPKLEWYKFQSRKDCTGSVLAAFELIEVSYISIFFSRDKYYTRGIPLLSLFFSRCNIFPFDVILTFIFQSCEHALYRHAQYIRQNVPLRRRRTRRFRTFR